MRRKQTMEPTTNINRTCLQGSIFASFKELLKTFGPPHTKGRWGRKTDVEWAFKFSDDTIATLYNWKNGRNYLGSDGLELNDIYEWKVGGRDKKAVSRLLERLSASRDCWHEKREMSAIRSYGDKE